MTFQVGRDDAGKLRELADAFISIVKPPARYKVASYKYACPEGRRRSRKTAPGSCGSFWISFIRHGYVTWATQRLKPS